MTSNKEVGAVNAVCFSGVVGHSGEDAWSDATAGHAGPERDKVSSANVLTIAICNKSQDSAYRSVRDASFRGGSRHFWCGEDLGF